MGSPFGAEAHELDLMFEPLRKAGIPTIGEVDNGVWAVSEMVKWVSRMGGGTEEYTLAPEGSEKEKALAIIREPADPHLTEHRAALVLNAYGIPTPRGIMTYSADEARSAAEEIGCPVVLKIQSPDILHKTDVGGLEINLSSPEEVRGAYERICSSINRRFPHARVEGVLVQEMLPRSTEVIIGVKQDELFGPTVMFGLGGVFVEVMEDVSFRVAPLSPHDAREMILEIRGYSLLEGVRGMPPADLEALEDILLKVSRLAVELSDHIAEMDINPLFVFPAGGGAMAADALITRNL